MKDRFKLYSTNNMYTFLNLYTATGKIYQLQWSFDAKNEGIVAVNSDDFLLDLLVGFLNFFLLKLCFNLFFLIKLQVDKGIWNGTFRIQTLD